jgi:hypothetical protein
VHAGIFALRDVHLPHRSYRLRDPWNVGGRLSFRILRGERLIRHLNRYRECDVRPVSRRARHAADAIARERSAPELPIRGVRSRLAPDVARPARERLALPFVHARGHERIARLLILLAQLFEALTHRSQP